MSSRKALVSDHAANSKELVIAISQTQPKEKRCSEYASRIKKLGVDLEEPTPAIGPPKQTKEPQKAEHRKNRADPHISV